MIAVRIYYADGTRLESWDDAPDGIQVVTFHNGEGPTLSHGVDEYRIPGSNVTKYGEWMDADAYETLLRRAYEEAKHWQPRMFSKARPLT